MKRLIWSAVFLLFCSAVPPAAAVFADTCPDPQEVKGGNLPPNWDEVDRPLNYANYFGEVSNNLEYVENFDRAVIDGNSITCHYAPNVTLQQFATAEPKDRSLWTEKELTWTCVRGWEECEFE